MPASIEKSLKLVVSLGGRAKGTAYLEGFEKYPLDSQLSLARRGSSLNTDREEAQGRATTMPVR
jgi:hypothetical protein